jgi:hypothetical protein
VADKAAQAQRVATPVVGYLKPPSLDGDFKNFDGRKSEIG